MKKKGREEAKKNIIKKSLSVAIAAVLVSSVLIVSMPLAAAPAPVTITKFEITPNTGITGEVAAYTVVLNTNGEFKTLNITLPEGFGAQTPTDSELIARVDLWNGTQYYGYITFTANGSDPSHKMDVHADIGGDTADATIDVDYSPGGTTHVGSPFAGGASYATLTLPSSDGKVDVSLPMGMKDITVDVKQFVNNPTVCGDYKFDAKVNGGTAVEYTVYIRNNPGDIHKDNVVNVLDLQRLAWAWGSVIGDANWNYCADLNNDGTIGVGDLQLLAWNYRNVYV
jgi:hypothetical protein